MDKNPRRYWEKIKIKQKDISKTKTWFQRKKGVPEKFDLKEKNQFPKSQSLFLKKKIVQKIEN